MAERRQLVEGVKPADIDPELAQRFIRGEFPAAKNVPPTGHPAEAAAEAATPGPAPPAGAKPALLNGGGRVPLTVRIRPEVAVAVKRASLERQLQGVEPSAQQDILEEALVPWLRQHGYLD